MERELAKYPQWNSFESGKWAKEINVRDFIQKNYSPYQGDGRFLQSPTDCTLQLWQKVSELMKWEREKGGVLDAETSIISE